DPLKRNAANSWDTTLVCDARVRPRPARELRSMPICPRFSAIREAQELLLEHFGPTPLIKSKSLGSAGAQVPQERNGTPNGLVQAARRALRPRQQPETPPHRRSDRLQHRQSWRGGRICRESSGCPCHCFPAGASGSVETQEN